MTESNNDNCTHAPNVTPCRLKTSHHTVRNAADLAQRLAEVFEDGDVVGIVWATNGTWPLKGISWTHEYTKRGLDVQSATFDEACVYEIRAWRVIDNPRKDNTLAHEFRWTNGMNAVELTLSVDTREPGEPTQWANYVEYEQNAPSGRGSQPDHNKTSQMTAIEYIEEDSTYGNMVVVDQLFTGKWN